MGVMCDGNSANRRFFKLHSKEEEVYKVKNPFTSEDRPIFFLSDPPHLMKTTQNCWESQKWKLWVSDINLVAIHYYGYFLCGLAEWEGDYVEAPDGSVQEMCWSKHQHTRIDHSSPTEV